MFLRQVSGDKPDIQAVILYPTPHHPSPHPTARHSLGYPQPSTDIRCPELPHRALLGAGPDGPGVPGGPHKP